MHKMTADDLIRALDLRPLPVEGGWFRETYRSPLALAGNSLTKSYSGARSLATAIYYLITPDHFSAMHRVPGDEVFHFYFGDPVEMLFLLENGTGECVVFGTDVMSGMRPQVVVPGGVWQGARLRDGGAFALLGTTMSPGFDAADFEVGERRHLVSRYPEFIADIERLTKA